MLHNAGRDWAASALFDRSGARAAAADYMAVSANVTPPDAADIVLAGEITTAGGGLVRRQATYAHTPGAATSTLTATFTANGTDVLPVALGKVGIFNAATAGTMPFSSLLNSPAPMNLPGDAVTITETVTTS